MARAGEMCRGKNRSLSNTMDYLGVLRVPGMILTLSIEVGFPEVTRGVMGKANRVLFLPACQCCDCHKSNEKWMPVVLKECA